MRNYVLYNSLFQIFILRLDPVGGKGYLTEVCRNENGRGLSNGGVVRSETGTSILGWTFDSEADVRVLGTRGPSLVSLRQPRSV